MNWAIINKNRLSLLILICSIGCIACSSKSQATLEKDKEPIVSVYGKTLYRSDLNDAISKTIGSADSAKSADAYIQMWVNEELIYEKAKQNVVDQDRIEELVENYRQSLIVFTYLEELLKKELSKDLSEANLKDYYEKHIDSFKLESSLVKGLFLKIPKSSADINNLKKWYKINTEEAKEYIEKSSIQNAVVYDYFYDKWVGVEDVISNIPIPINDPDQFVKLNKNFETEDSTYVYLLHIEEYALAGSNAPYLYAKPQITDILINQKREAFLKQFEKDLYDNALKKDNIKYYINKNAEEQATNNQ